MIDAGRIIDGRYVVEAELGSGGMGVVVRARHRFTGALHALKMLRADYAMDAEAQNRFLAEARAANAIGHHGIVQVLDAGKTPEGELYLVMELLAGLPLRNAMVRTGLAPHQVRQVGLELLDALGAAHARGFVHRDLKPENVFLVGATGTVKLLDFGIAKMMQPVGMTTVPRTAAGVVLGTLAYMAPEQLHDARSVDLRADLWAAGVMFYEMLSGRLPYPQTTMTELYIALESDEPMPISAFLPGAPPPILQFFQRALARDPNRRFQSTQEMAAALGALPLVQGVASPNQTMMTGGAWASQPQKAPPSTMMTGPTAMGTGNVAQGTGPVPGAPIPGAPSTVHVAQQTAPSPVAVAQQTAPQPPYGGVHTPYPLAPAPIVQHQTPYPPQAPPTQQTRGPSSKTFAAVGLAVVAVGLIVTAVVIATRGDHKGDVVSETKPLPEHVPTQQGGQTIERHEVPAPTQDPPPQQPVQKPPVQKPPVQKPPQQPQQPQPQQPYPPERPPPQQQSRAAECETACRSLAACGLNMPTCPQQCAADNKTYACVRAGSCVQYAQCGFAEICHGAMPHGNFSCAAVAKCQQNCPHADINCGCRCAESLAPAKAPILLLLDFCAVACNFDDTCVQQRCSGFGQVCLAN